MIHSATVSQIRLLLYAVFSHRELRPLLINPLCTVGIRDVYAMAGEERSVFVTVGTTRFDGLIGAVAEENFMKVRKSQTHNTFRRYAFVFAVGAGG